VTCCFRTWLWRTESARVARAATISVSSAVLLLAACSFPFLSLHAKGLESAITLLQAARELWLGGREVLAVLVFAFIVAVPGVMVVALLALLTPLVRGSWAYIAFCVCFTAALSSLDRAYVWDAIERVSRA
jgi:paraquat-inducible protein A